MASDLFHVVRIRFNDKITGYQVYADNEPYIKGAKQSLAQREARWIAKQLNKAVDQAVKAGEDIPALKAVRAS